MSIEQYPWYAVVDADDSVTQGELLFECPVLDWKDLPKDTPVVGTKPQSQAKLLDLIVMTQACDLENSKLQMLVACPHFSATDLWVNWEAEKKKQGQNPTKKSFSKYLENISKSHHPSLCLLDKSTLESYPFEVRIVDFHQTYSLPISFVGMYLKSRSNPRVRLLPPYREHLSQAFARFFMRVGLPQNIDTSKL